MEFEALARRTEELAKRRASIYTLGRNGALAAVDDGGTEEDVDSHWNNIGSTFQHEYPDWTQFDLGALERGFMFTLRDKGVNHTPHGVCPEYYK